MANIAILGLGHMGSAFAEILLTAGWRVTGYDPSAGAMDALNKLGGSARPTPAEAAREADFVLTSLPSAVALDAVIAGDDGLATLEGRRRILVDTSTFALDEKVLARDRLPAGWVMLDCTVSGNRDMILNKTLTLFASGDAQGKADCKELFAAIAGPQFDVGEFGNASRIKFIVNHLVVIHTVATAEAMALGIKAGLDPQLLFDLVRNSAANSRIWEIRGRMMVQEDYTSSRGSYLIADKDAKIISDFAGDLRFPVPLFAQAHQTHYLGMAQGWGDKDAASLCAVFEKLTNAVRTTASK